jgi:hypothetical protein
MMKNTLAWRSPLCPSTTDAPQRPPHLLIMGLAVAGLVGMPDPAGAQQAVRPPASNNMAHAGHPVHEANPANPADAAAPVPPLAYRSALASYRRLGDNPVASWRDANETVNRIGGWRTYAREAPAPAASPAATPPPAASAGPAASPPAPSQAPPPAPHTHR